jgi:peptidoglycan hydrolase-like protein with peptidoglycan-binding domain
MSVTRLGLTLMAVALVSGCASMTKKQVSRLSSQVGLLDERVTQLERTGAGGSAAWSEPSIDVGSSYEATSPSSRSSSKKAAGAAASAKSGKYSTREIQQALKNAGFYEGSVDGKIGPKTRGAIKEFQRVHGLKDDGVVGRQTWTKLSSYTDLSSGGTSAAQTADAGSATSTEFFK